MERVEIHDRPIYPKTNSPLKAIRWFCTDCMGGQMREISDCTDRGCSLWPFRFGMRPTAARKAGKDV